MQLACKNCGEPIQVRNVNVQTMTAACESCNAVFRFDVQELETTKSKRTKLTPPAGLSVLEESEHEFSADIRWREILGSVEWTLIVLMLAGMVVLGGGAVALFRSALDDAVLGKLILGGIFATIAGVCTYIFLMVLLLTSRLTVDSDWLTFKHRPLYWRGLRIHREDIASVTLKPLDSYSEYRTLMVTLRDGSQRKIDHFQIPQARYLQQELQQALFSPPPESEQSPADFTPDDVEHMTVSDDGELIIEEASPTSAVNVGQNST